MHLTNYAVNKHNENFVAANTASVEEGQTEDASKWSLAQLKEYIGAQGGCRLLSVSPAGSEAGG